MSPYDSLQISGGFCQTLIAGGPGTKSDGAEETKHKEDGCLATLQQPGCRANMRKPSWNWVIIHDGHFGVLYALFLGVGSLKQQRFEGTVIQSSNQQEKYGHVTHRNGPAGCQTGPQQVCWWMVMSLDGLYHQVQSTHWVCMGKKCSDVFYYTWVDDSGCLSEFVSSIWLQCRLPFHPDTANDARVSEGDTAPRCKSPQGSRQAMPLSVTKTLDWKRAAEIILLVCCQWPACIEDIEPA